jgi:RNA polymerase sigma-70 factor (ECF subfamily)
MTPSSSQTSAEAFERYRSYLHLLAQAHLRPRMQARLDASDLVQQTLLDAHQKQAQFRGESEGERLAWLKQILANNLADAVRGMARAKRDVNRERPLEHEVAGSFSRVEGWLAAVQSSPSQQTVRAEELVRLADGLATLPPAQRDAIVLHHLQGQTLAEVGRQLDKTPAAVAGLLHRGLKQLRELMAADERDSLSGPS